MKRTLSLLLLSLMMPWLCAQNSRTEHDWTFNPNLYPNNMTMVLSVTIDGVAIADDNIELGAFCNGVCQGKCFPQLFEPTLQYVYNLSVLGTDGQCFEFFLRDKDEVEQEVVTDYSVCFVENDLIRNVTLDFFEQDAELYTLVTDPKQLAAGRRYLLTNGQTTGAKTLGYQDEDGRVAVSLSVTDNRASMLSALNPVTTSQAYQLGLELDEDYILIKDLVNDAYLEASATGELTLAATDDDATRWNYDIYPNGVINIYTTIEDNIIYIYYDVEDALFKVSADAADLSLYVRCVMVDSEISSLVITEGSLIHVVPANTTLNLTEFNVISPDVLLFETGAQIVTSVEGVKGTSQFDVVAYTEPDVADGYYTIASPMLEANVNTCPGLLSSEYDLFAFDETNIIHQEWRNVKDSVSNGFTNYEPGRGYLYSNNLSGSPAFVGTYNHASVSVDLTVTNRPNDDLDGFNLIGNPYPHAIYKGAGGAIDDDNLASGYYVLENSGSWLAKTYADPIKPCQGILVKASEAGTLTINKVTAAATAESAVTDGLKSVGARRMTDLVHPISISIQSGRYRDDAHVYFDEGHDLDKIENLDETAPRLYVFKEGNKYAIAHVDEGQGHTTLGFKTMKTDTYTMTFKFDKSQYETLRLVDHLTGVTVDLLSQESYTFTGRFNDYSARFELCWKDGAEELNDVPFAFLDEEGCLVLEGVGENAVVQIIDMMGRVISLSDYRGYHAVPGVYVVRILDRGQEHSQKLIW